MRFPSCFTCFFSSLFVLKLCVFLWLLSQFSAPSTSPWHFRRATQTYLKAKPWNASCVTSFFCRSASSCSSSIGRLVMSQSDACCWSPFAATRALTVQWMGRAMLRSDWVIRYRWSVLSSRDPAVCIAPASLAERYTSISWKFRILAARENFLFASANTQNLAPSWNLSNLDLRVIERSELLSCLTPTLALELKIEANLWRPRQDTAGRTSSFTSRKAVPSTLPFRRIWTCPLFASYWIPILSPIWWKPFSIQVFGWESWHLVPFPSMKDHPGVARYPIGFDTLNFESAGTRPRAMPRSSVVFHSSITISNSWIPEFCFQITSPWSVCHPDPS
mmetsp:Transcript_4922/g.11803  ORF Transcript_4922/g.11803 Transcript_4922/m.11803 type:complete len:333 (-) Transcript_4922:566-1564(-)